MKNLKIHKSRLMRVKQLNDAVSAFIINDGELCYATKRQIWRWSVDNDQPRPVIDLSAMDSGYLDVTIKCYAYITPWDSFVVSCSNGNVLLAEEGNVESAYKTCDGDAVVDMLCSPDFERVAFLHGEGRITMVTECFDVLNDFSVFDEDALAENSPVNVGWGKKETQFHGSEGKDKRVAKEVIGDGDDADDSINICWRSDSLLFAVGYLKKVTNLRSIKIFNRDGVLQNISEPLSGVEAVLSWKTTKELMSFPQHTDGKYFISFMEKNGLKHGEFVIPPTISVRQLLWNQDSSILCILCNNSSDNSSLLFLSPTNYVWQIKKCMLVDLKIITARWLPNNSLQYITEDGIYTSLHLIESLCTSSPGTQDWVAVIDYCSVLLTPFKQVIIPPPMFDLKITLDSPVDCVLYLPHNQRYCKCFKCYFLNDHMKYSRLGLPKHFNYVSCLNEKQAFLNTYSLKITMLCVHNFYYYLHRTRLNILLRKILE